ncbi:sporulation protein [Neobacillus notoginsengisoli]|uniref:Sporulation protein n=1 Tax=Neobacillus notoginsengisoli TaxID=1578198 RepID=A0A417YUE2_9BACI|nr:sporulation membrane protein YtrI [Neobacillus notoginsengisoli]RHW40735.1 sporulation protein [Neobacillus notoginsengisoli]
MRVPPYYKDKSWQRFFAGLALGGVLGWLLLLYMHGILQEKQTMLIKDQQDTIQDLRDDIKIWQDEFKNLNKENIEQLLVQKITVKITNPKRYNIDLLSIAETEEAVVEDLKTLKAKDIETVYKNKDLIKKVIENRTVTINGKKYRLEVEELIIFTNVIIQLKIYLAK